jgi:uncharacterized protein YmfQ (DUF2313 family)
MPAVELYATDEAASSDDGSFDIVTEDYAIVIPQFLPRGPAWNFKIGGIAHKLIRAISLELSRVERRGLELIEEMDPRTCQELLEDWERALGLPALCQGGTSPTSLDKRREAIHAKLTSRPFGNAPFFLDLASKLGYPNAELRYEGDPLTCIDPCIDSLRGYEGGWLEAWTLVANTSTENDATLTCLVLDYAQAPEIVTVEFP